MKKEQSWYRTGESLVFQFEQNGTKELLININKRDKVADIIEP
jgi:hypothetical protein